MESDARDQREQIMKNIREEQEKVRAEEYEKWQSMQTTEDTDS